ncbi:hypothetical protein [Methanolobus sp.]|jgi:hypothetical protein|uniref:hypothetical protein n=1 Tax=Methanolobus sp. TaxID=1874737 RepID=UPI0025E942D0|nr:hypothetical protein [Methanolobus sp.]
MYFAHILISIHRAVHNTRIIKCIDGSVDDGFAAMNHPMFFSKFPIQKILVVLCTKAAASPVCSIFNTFGYRK